MSEVKTGKPFSRLFREGGSPAPGDYEKAIDALEAVLVEEAAPAEPVTGEEKDGGRRMFVEVRIKMEVDTDKWAETYDTTGQKASDVRKDIRDWARDCVFDEGEPLGIEPSDEVG